MIKKMCILLNVVFACFMFTGCVKIDMNVSMNELGDISSSMEMIAPDYLLGDNDGSLKNSMIEKNPKAKVEVFKDNDDSHVKLTNPSIKISKLYNEYKKNEDNFNDTLIIEKESGLFYDKYSCIFLLEQSVSDEMDDSYSGLLGMMNDALDFNFTLELPMELDYANNTHYIDEKDGVYTYIWRYGLTDMNDISFAFTMLNTSRIAGLVLSLIIIVAILYLVKKYGIENLKNMWILFKEVDEKLEEDINVLEGDILIDNKNDDVEEPDIEKEPDIIELDDALDFVNSEMIKEDEWSGWEI